MSALSLPPPIRSGRLPRLAALPLLVAAALGWLPALARADDTSGNDADFDMDFFPAGTAPRMDLSRFARSGYVMPGVYRGDIVFNGQWRARTDIVFEDVQGAGLPQPCFDAESLSRYGVDWTKVAAADPRPTLAPSADRFCGPLGDYVPGATVVFDTSTQVLTLTVPQIYTSRHARGYVDPSLWDAGVPAAAIGYSASLYRTEGHHRGSSGYLGVQAAFSAGAWRAFHAGSMSWSPQLGSRYQATSTYLQHDIPAWRAQLAIGDTFTSGELFDSLRMQGVRLASDSRMDPQSRRGYAPVVRGIAETSARVVIRQRGYVVYDTSVAPGPFAIEDLYPTGYGGDLDVEIAEADGRVKRFSVPFSAVTHLLRPGAVRWSVSAGRLDELDLADAPRLIQGTYERGLSNHTTAYAGAIAGDHYHAALLGGAWNTGAGAFSADLTRARNRAPGQAATQGVSARLGYNRNFVDTGTDFSVAAYRYSTSGFVSFRDAALLRDAIARGREQAGLRRQRSRMDLSVNQMLGEGGGLLFVTGSTRDFWGGRGRETEFTAGYNNHWRSLSYSLSVQRTRDSVAWTGTPAAWPVFISPSTPQAVRRDTHVSFTVSVPLGRTAGAPTATGMFNRSRDGGDHRSLSVAGAAGRDHRLAYGATLGESGGRRTLDLTTQYNARQAHWAGAFSHGDGYRQISGGVSGGMVIHGGGLTLSPPLAETIGLVHAPDAAGAHVENGQGARVDRRGYAVVPNLMPYELNTVTLDPKGTDAGVELKETTRNVAPRAGTVVLLKYETTAGRAVIVRTRLQDGRPVPFGAEVLDLAGNPVGVAGQASRLYLNGLQHSGVITVRWGIGEAEQCRVQVNLAEPAGRRQQEFEQIEATCNPFTAPAQSAPAFESGAMPKKEH